MLIGTLRVLRRHAPKHDDTNEITKPENDIARRAGHTPDFVRWFSRRVLQPVMMPPWAIVNNATGRAPTKVGIFTLLN
jgi:hypothetical protein